MSWMSGQLPGHPGNTGTTVQVSAMSGHSRDILVTQAEPQNGFRVAPEVQQYTSITISGIRPFLDSPSMLLSTTQEQNVTALGIHQLKADLTIQVEPQNSPYAAPEVQQKQRNPHSIKRCADIPYIKNRVAHAFTIQLPVLY